MLAPRIVSIDDIGSNAQDNKEGDMLCEEDTLYQEYKEDALYQEYEVNELAPTTGDSPAASQYVQHKTYFRMLT